MSRPMKGVCSGKGAMDMMMKAVETTGSVDERGQLHVDQPLVIAPGRVRILLLLEEGDIDEKEWLRVAANNPAFDFLKSSAEDIYATNDGKPFRDEG